VGGSGLSFLAGESAVGVDVPGESTTGVDVPGRSTVGVDIVSMDDRFEGSSADIESGLIVTARLYL